MLVTEQAFESQPTFLNEVNGSDNCALAGLQGCVPNKTTTSALALVLQRHSKESSKKYLQFEDCAHIGEVCDHLETPVSPLTQTLTLFLSYVAPTPHFPGKVVQSQSYQSGKGKTIEIESI